MDNESMKRLRANAKALGFEKEFHKQSNEMLHSSAATRKSRTKAVHALRKRRTVLVGQLVAELFGDPHLASKVEQFLERQLKGSPHFLMPF